MRYHVLIRNQHFESLIETYINLHISLAENATTRMPQRVQVVLKFSFEAWVCSINNIS